MKIFRIMLNQEKFFSHSFSYAWPYCQLFLLLFFFPKPTVFSSTKSLHWSHWLGPPCSFGQSPDDVLWASALLELLVALTVAWLDILDKYKMAGWTHTCLTHKDWLQELSWCVCVYVHSRVDASNTFQRLLVFAASFLGFIQPCFSSAGYRRAPLTHGMHEAFASIVIT